MDYFGYRAFPAPTFQNPPKKGVFPDSPLGDLGNFILGLTGNVEAPVIQQFQTALSGAEAIFDPNLSWKTRLEGSSKLLGPSATVVGVLGNLASGKQLTARFIDILGNLAANEIAATAPDGLSQVATIEYKTFNSLKTLVGETPTTFWGLVLQSVSFGLTALADEAHIVALDPPDPNYKTIAQSTFIPINSLSFNGVSAQNRALARDLLNGVAQAEEYLRLSAVSANRYSSALAADDVSSALSQLMAFVDYLSSYNGVAQMLTGLLQQFEMALAAESLTGLTYDPTLISELQNVFRQQGLSDEVLSFLQSLGLNGAQILDIGEQLLGLDPNAFSGTLGQHVEIASSAIFETTTASVPEPPMLITLSLIFSVATARVSRRRRARALTGAVTCSSNAVQSPL